MNMQSGNIELSQQML